ncbi:MAG: carboxy-S-adenosyl-L-methionine synthase CmoA [Desulfobacteraceae bacterium]|nr:carboxy-S-adenosyl-L-methionine synthase CmoA [Desulfobacteraceae bacterium]
MDKDRIFARQMKKVSPFEFDENVAHVFNDMLDRSVPLYQESIKWQARLACRFYKEETIIYDLGCSNGNLGLMILNEFKTRKFSMNAIDSSAPMIEKYRARLKEVKTESVNLTCNYIENIQISNASVVIINLTMQFLDMEKRAELVKNIYNGLVKGGILLLTEKVDQDDETFKSLHQDFYKEFKLENGYSELEISQKRDALEKVLVPETIADHEKRIEQAGFNNFDIFLKWFNFASMIAYK